MLKVYKFSDLSELLLWNAFISEIDLFAISVLCEKQYLNVEKQNTVDFYEKPCLRTTIEKRDIGF